MSDNNGDDTTTASDPVEQASQDAELPTASGQSEASDDDPDRPSRREAKYRTQLREVEAQRDELAATVEAMQRAEVERIAAEHLTKPTALWTAGVELASLVGDDGTVDPSLVESAAQDAREQLGLEHPQAKLRRGPVVPKEGTSVHRGSGGNSWQDAFRG